MTILLHELFFLLLSLRTGAELHINWMKHSRCCPKKVTKGTEVGKRKAPDTTSWLPLSLAALYASNKPQPVLKWSYTNELQGGVEHALPQAERPEPQASTSIPLIVCWAGTAGWTRAACLRAGRQWVGCVHLGMCGSGWASPGRWWQ